MLEFCAYEKCGQPLPVGRANRPGRRFCNNTCKKSYDREAYYDPNPLREAGLSPSTIGAVAELRVAVDLMAKGFHVFRALSPACECDLAIVKNGRFYRVEVKTRQRSKTTGIVNAIGKIDSTRFDVLAIVCGETIAYTPDLGLNGS